MSRQKAAHKSAKAAEVEAVGATCQGGCPRVPGERGRGGAGGPDWRGGGVQPCILFKLSTEGIEGRICADSLIGFRELSEVFERSVGNFVTGHTSVELSRLIAVVIHELLKSFVTTSTKTLLRPPVLALEKELSQSLKDFLNGGEEILDGFASLRTVVVSGIYIAIP
ncbi:3-hydroxyphenylacetate 6-hydroxylase [Babesia caballi]|uniref:3-hydroxyphenylacetate 6-hydroxylase n=1 Tax=Babesia caballi TaxID=5871 RepID=A0AAV4LYT3_BABCB|nr:3-hydroxyphenylacetate 6-hydroxylase [Babesia caballi]